MNKLCRRKLVMVCTGAWVVGACVPIPRTITLAPAISGTVELPNGAPLVGEPLRLSLGRADSTCTKPVAHTRTDSLGAFRFAAVRQRESYTMVLFDRGFCYQVCGARRDSGAAFQSCYLHAVPDSVFVSCAVSLGQPPDDAPFRCAERRKRPRVERPSG